MGHLFIALILRVAGINPVFPLPLFTGRPDRGAHFCSDSSDAEILAEGTGGDRRECAEVLDGFGQDAEDVVHVGVGCGFEQAEAEAGAGAVLVEAHGHEHVTGLGSAGVAG
jgi:hypothetical protein